MMKKYLILCLLATGCATTTVGDNQAECENHYSAFAEIVACTKESFANDSTAKNDANFKLYILKGDQLAEKVRSKEISDLDAKVEWQKLYIELKNSEEKEEAAAAAKYNAIKPRQTVCTPIGNSVTCNTY